MQASVSFLCPRLAVIGLLAVFPKKMFVVKRLAYRGRLWMNANGKISHSGSGLQHPRVFRRLWRVRTPSEWTVIRDQDRGDRHRIYLLECPDDGLSRIRFVLAFDFVIGHRFGQGDRSVEIVGMRGTKTWNRFTRLGPGRSVLRM